MLLALEFAHARDGGYARWRESMIMEMLAFLGRGGYQSADGLARNRSVVWIAKLANKVGEILKAEADAMRSAANRPSVE